MVLSTLRTVERLFKKILQSPMMKRGMSDHRLFPLAPSRFSWNKFKDMTHFYIMLGVIPATIGITYCNVFIGPATLSEIPPDYTPKNYEYYRSPITRFLAKYITANPQQEYEKYLCYSFMEDEKRMLRELEANVQQKVKERDDYQVYYYRPVLAKYHRQSKEAADYVESIRGD